jgi:phage portal protein BeeE
MQKDIRTQHISRRTEVLIRLLLLGRFDLTEVAMITGISEQLLQDYLSTQYIGEYQQMRF